ncbi:hypothetical protein [Nonomuraea cavernae]|uniref:Uncharacterized protein n=1 Tax=Nonomuraea cavernae TaxID=2045107 RepID=A0A917YPN9_9ACTN|nr:hypothetical protein [Nonomuraea cavernae]MCA2184137.1 hypothetical protein [Nonomuraea cavernae]GGO62421.1 hypothetical protein GCM10012289_07040 [Nonomuraea cavernae]
MIRLGDFLARFRPSGVPGAAAPAGVPEDYVADQAEELEPIFSALADIQAACANEREHAQRRGDRMRARAHDRAAAIVASAHAEADAERARSAALARRHHDQAVAESAPSAAAEGVRTRSAARMPEMVARVTDLVRSLADERS